MHNSNMIPHGKLEEIKQETEALQQNGVFNKPVTKEQSAEIK